MTLASYSRLLQNNFVRLQIEINHYLTSSQHVFGELKTIYVKLTNTLYIVNNNILFTICKA